VCLKLSTDFQYLIGYEHRSPLEIVWIWSLTTKKVVHKEILDLDDNIDHMEDPSKLFALSSDNILMFMRSDNKKGVKVISLQDGVKIGETK